MAAHIKICDNSIVGNRFDADNDDVRDQFRCISACEKGWTSIPGVVKKFKSPELANASVDVHNMSSDLSGEDGDDDE
eukprot:12407458-Karenia_brevis.AAC.1